MSERPWETHDRLCSSRRPSVAYPSNACPECRAIGTARADAHAAALDAVIEVSQHDFPDIDPLEFDTPFDYAKAICEAALKGVDE